MYRMHIPAAGEAGGNCTDRGARGLLAGRRARRPRRTRNRDEQPMVRLAHFSDIHVTTKPLGWRSADWFNKRFPAWVNLRLLGRAYRFRHANRVLDALVAELRQRQP